MGNNENCYRQPFANVFQKETPTQVFSCEYCEILKNSLFYRSLAAAASIMQCYQGVHNQH